VGQQDCADTGDEKAWPFNSFPMKIICQERRLLQSMGWNPDEHDDDEGGLEAMRWAIRVGGDWGGVAR
jgi:hypothetical protein